MPTINADDERNLKTITMRPEDLYKFPRTRSSAVTCLSYGKDRKTKFPGYFFCHGCDLLEDAILNGNKRANREQLRYACTGGSVHPYRPNNNKDSAPKVKEDHDSSDEDRDHMMPRCAEYAATPPAAKSSPTKSPLKKKVRRSRRLLSTSRTMNYAEGGSSTSSDNESSVEDEEAIHQQFATALSFLDDDGGGGDNETEEVLVSVGCDTNRHLLSAAFQEVDNEVGKYDDGVAQDVIEYITDIETKNVALTERLCEVERSMSMQITALEMEITDLNAKLVMLGTNRLLTTWNGMTMMRMNINERSALIGRMQRYQMFCRASSAAF